MSKKKTDRLAREKLIQDLISTQDEHLEELIKTTEKKHANGGIFKTKKEYRQTQLCYEAFKEEGTGN